MSAPTFHGEQVDVKRLSCTNCAALQAQIDALLASRASRSGDTAKAKRTAAFPRKGHRLALLEALERFSPVDQDDFPRGTTYGKCPWKRLSELFKMGLAERENGFYRITAAGRDWLSELRRQS